VGPVRHRVRGYSLHDPQTALRVLSPERPLHRKGHDLGRSNELTARGKGHLQGTKVRTAPTADGSWPRSTKRPKRVSLFTSSVQYCTRILAARTCPDSTASWKLGKRRARQDLSYGGSVMGGSRRTRSLRERKAGRHTLRDHALKLALQAAITCLSPPPARSRALQS
jgi:hypothetical protein